MPIQTMEGPSSVVPFAGSQSGGCGGFSTIYRVRATGLGQIVGMLVVSAPTATPAVRFQNAAGTQVITVPLAPNAAGNYPIDLAILLPYVTIHPGGVGGTYTSMSFTTNMIPGGAGVGSGGGGGGGGGNEVVSGAFASAVAQNAEHAVATLAVESAKIKIASVTLVASDNLDYQVLFYNAVTALPADFVAAVPLLSANAILVAGDTLFLYSAECEIPYQNAGGTLSLFATISPRSGGKAATACTLTVAYYPEED